MTPNRKIKANDEIEKKLRELKESYLAALPAELDALQSLLAVAEGAPSLDKIEKLRHLSHRIKGTSATYGCRSVAQYAGELEKSLIIAQQDQSYPWNGLNRKLDLLKREIDQARIECIQLETATTIESEGHLLIVDDDSDFLRLMATILTEQGFQVSTSNEPEKVFDLIEDRKPELLLIDVEMPSMDGYQLCQLLRTNDQAREMQIIFLTAHNNKDNRIAAFRAGADDFINKPIVLEELLARVKVRMGRARLLREKQAILEQLRNEHESLLSVLNQLRIGTLIIDDAGKVSFMSQSCARLGGIPPEQARGQPWYKAFPFDEESKKEIGLQLQNCGKTPTRPHASWRIHGKLYYVEFEIKEVPTRTGQHLLYLYDQSEIVCLKRQIEQSRFHEMIGNSEPMQQMYGLIEQVARGDWTVLIEGETGVGKELVAHSIHATSPRKNHPFVAVNSAGLSETLLSSQLFGHRRGAFTGAVSDQEGFFEAASGGTLFLDEIGDIPLAMQAALLRVLQEKEITRLGESRSRKVDVRIVAATHKDLTQEVEAGRFREDLFYRLRVARIRVPPLRERKEDISILTTAFLAESCRTANLPAKTIADEAVNQLQKYHWPGNVRELKATIDHAVIRSGGEMITVAELPPELNRCQHQKTETEPPLQNTDIIKPDSDRIMAALERAGGNRTAAAKLLGVSRATFYRHLKELGISLSL